MDLNWSSLKESNEFLNILLDNITSAVFIVDKNIRIVQINQAFQSLFHKSSEKILGTLCGNGLNCIFPLRENTDCGLTAYCNKCSLRASLLKAFTKKIPTYKQKLSRYFIIDGKKVKKYLFYSSKFIDFNGKEMVLIIVDDFTELERKKIELEIKNRQLTKLNFEKNSFLGIAAHDLRNPAAAIQTFSQILKEELKDHLSYEQKEYFSMIFNSTQFILKLLDELLDIVKIESGNLDIYLSENDYLQVLKSNLSLNRSLAKSKNIQIHFIEKNSIPIISFDMSKIEQVLNNLLSNALKFSYPDSSITVEVESDKTNIITRIIDEGQGIPEPELEKIFIPFRNSSVRATKGEKSTGLGLAISKKIIESHNGSLSVSSKVGKGSVFSFTLPIKN
ncbi:MAG TPA: hypothetical protein DHW82_11310 [Spirochaetia bacterium]|nr:MAG: hypothetical protein A2Y41_11350 [Spirochaetes bacterium GWB1_36_13]HCL57579.1 hypothetical protein [Spirochaetia bacterium]